MNSVTDKSNQENLSFSLNYQNFLANFRLKKNSRKLFLIVRCLCKLNYLNVNPCSFKKSATSCRRTSLKKSIFLSVQFAA